MRLVGNIKKLLWKLEWKIGRIIPHQPTSPEDTGVKCSREKSWIAIVYWLGMCPARHVLAQGLLDCGRRPDHGWYANYSKAAHPQFPTTAEEMGYFRKGSSNPFAWSWDSEAPCSWLFFQRTVPLLFSSSLPSTLATEFTASSFPLTNPLLFSRLCS